MKPKEYFSLDDAYITYKNAVRSDILRTPSGTVRSDKRIFDYSSNTWRYRKVRYPAIVLIQDSFYISSIISVPQVKTNQRFLT